MTHTEQRPPLQRAEYAVEVVGRGFVRCNQSTHPSTGITTTEVQVHRLEHATIHTSRNQAEQTAELTRFTFVDLGCPDVAENVRILSRTVMTAYDEWAVDNE